MHGGAPDCAGRIFVLKALAVAASCSILCLRSDQDQGPRQPSPDSTGARHAWLRRRIATWPTSMFSAVMDCSASIIDALLQVSSIQAVRLASTQAVPGTACGAPPVM
jgi:hypothetical protein